MDKLAFVQLDHAFKKARKNFWDYFDLFSGQKFGGCALVLNRSKLLKLRRFEERTIRAEKRLRDFLDK